jgi:hypothetical protein
MSEQDEHKVTDAPAPAARHARASLADLLAFLGVLVLAGGLAFLLDCTGQLSARLAFAGAAGLVAACVTAWRRLRRVELRRWRSGQVTYRGRRVTARSASPHECVVDDDALSATNVRVFKAAVVRMKRRAK